MKNKLSYYSELCEERTADFTSKHQKEYKLDELKALINTLKRSEKESLKNIPDNYFELLNEIFELLPVHERYFAVIESEKLKQYFSKIEDLKNRILKEYGFNYHNNLRQSIKKVLSFLFPFSPLGFLFLKDFSVLGFTFKETQSIIQIFVIISTISFYFWRKYKWKKSQI